jgi:hypothetical protein
MPFTPYHFGPGLLLGVVLFPFVDISTMMIASVVLDIEPIAVIFLGFPSPLHGFLHSYLGATLVAIILSLVIWPMRDSLNSIVSLFGLHQESSLRHIIPASFIGAYFHVFLDSFIYPEMNPFYPLIGNPFIGALPVAFVYSSCVYLGLLGLGIYSLRILYNYFQHNKIEPEPDVFSSL